ncbi:hypothetical protein T439DRAFT_299565 [Meredithblackwellia eburnea MCA 4105]
MAPAPPLTAARLSSLSTKTLSQILELTRSVQEGIPNPTLPLTVSKNLSTLKHGIAALDEKGGPEGGEVVRGLRGQYDRLVGLVTGLGVEVEQDKAKTGVLVDAGDDESGEGLGSADGSNVPLQTLNPKDVPHVTISFPPEDGARGNDIERMEMDEEEMRRANSEVLQMQQQMMDDQDETLNSLSSAIARQHQLSLHISSELEMQEGLLNDTDAAVDRTQSNLRRASGRLDRYSRKARDTGSTGLIVALVIVLAILVVIFKT